MAVLSRVKMNKARHKQAQYSEEHKRRDEPKSKPISEEEHQERLAKLKEIGIIKDD